MPLYEYQCRECSNSFELYFPLQEWDVVPSCPDCGAESQKQLSAKIQREEPVWLDDETRGVLQDLDDPNTKPIENRTEYKRHLKENGIIERG